MLVSLVEAKEHLRVVDDDEDLTLQIYIDAAIASVSEYIQRAIYPDDASMADAMSKLTQLMAAFDRASLLGATVQTSYSISFYAADNVDFTNQIGTYSLQQIENYADSGVQADIFLQRFIRARDLYRKTLNGMVITPDIKAAILLTIGHLYGNRANVVSGTRLVVLEVPMAAAFLMQPHRAGMGV